MSTVIKNGTIVTADLSYAADVLVEGGGIAALGGGLADRRLPAASPSIVIPAGAPQVRRAGIGEPPRGPWLSDPGYSLERIPG